MGKYSLKWTEKSNCSENVIKAILNLDLAQDEQQYFYGLLIRFPRPLLSQCNQAFQADGLSNPLF